MTTNVKTGLAETRILLQRLRDSQAYFLNSLDGEIEELDRAATPTALDLVRARAFGLAYAGHLDLAICSFDALVSQKNGRTPRTLNKLAQLLIRRADDGDLTRAKKSAKAAIELAKDNNAIELWFAHHNLAAIYLRQGKLEQAHASATKAQKYREDPRTEALLRLSTQTSTEASDATLKFLTARGLVSLDISTDNLASRREGLALILKTEPIPAAFRPGRMR